MNSSGIGSGFNYGLNFQNGIGPVMEQTVKFHDQNMMIMLMIACLVGGMMMLICTNTYSSLEFIDSKVVEMCWTFLPVFILVTLALPSLELLYNLDCPSDGKELVTIRAQGLQWYWRYMVTYEVTGANFTFDSYMLEHKNKNKGFRLLEVDNPLFAPRKELVKMEVTGGDVIHSFAIPSLGLKMDGVPGRTNEGGFMANKMGSYYGQCSEICGANHSFMPMNLEVLPLDVFLSLYDDH